MIERGTAVKGNTIRLTCWKCGKPVSTEVPADTVVRGLIYCPECAGAE